ncbi:protein phosphatase 2C domain-containing protein [Paractinoplanes lichenicola]|uniref:Protein phosphatase 2C domain-containing protein n=1 Tax=Paractinoplanes lichenicola TaxID=2802976 RepID=A0ABS1W279_9ACTN|nr:protein phosphatase 2C domain-containing protein [Actinoplanes lichenicola]MBL7260658.1 protein phosphatase 2C domain-containing protein [Actinoplanes lichenicola]
MRVIDAVTEAAPGSDNEDLWLAGDNWALVLDGAGRYPGESGGCVHPITWVVARLGEHIAKNLDARPTDRLTELVRDAVCATMANHGPACDMSDPLSPGAACAVARHTGSHVEWLVVADCAVVIEDPDGDCTAVIDDRVDRLSGAPVTTERVRTYRPDYVRTVRNKPEGFWVLGAVPEAADHALIGSVPAAMVKRVLICSDGISRLTERYDWTWRQAFDRFDQVGAKGLVKAVRKAEDTDVEPTRWRGKPHDDATAVVLSGR